jgi:hypothetical protein
MFAWFLLACVLYVFVVILAAGIVEAESTAAMTLLAALAVILAAGGLSATVQAIMVGIHGFVP